MCTKTAFKKEYNPLIMNLISLLGNANPTVKITVSMKILEIIIAANSHPFNRYFVMLTVFVNFISASVELISQGKSSCIFALFSQNWFLKVIKEVEEDRKDLFICYFRYCITWLTCTSHEICMGWCY